MAQSMLGNGLLGPHGIDKRFRAGDDSIKTVGAVVFTANAGGTTSTIVGANAAPGTNDANIVRRNEKFRLFTAAGVPKDNNVYRITNIAVAASTTVTFTPAAPVATASGDFARRVTLDDFMDTESMDRRLFEINPTSYTTARLASMSPHDKMYALRVELNKDGM